MEFKSGNVSISSKSDNSIMIARKIVKIRQWMEYPRVKLWNNGSRCKRFENFREKKGKKEYFDFLANEQRFEKRELERSFRFLWKYDYYCVGNYIGM